jgi:Tfp pilus assembly protein FimT
LEQQVKIKSFRGFSLVEMLTVIALLMIVVTIAVPNYKAFRQNTNLKEAARDISSDISLYRQRAVAENRGYRINFDASANNDYTISQETVVNNIRTGNYPALGAKDVGAGNAGIAISVTPSFDGGVTYIQFDARGTTMTTCANTCALTLTNNRLSTAIITTNLMGRVNVKYTLK